MKLQGKVAIITGGSQGIGLGCAHVFVKYGCKVVLADRDVQAGRTAESNLVSAGHDVCFVSADVSEASDVKSLIDAAVGKFGRLDCVLNNAGWHPPAATIDDTSAEDFVSLLRQNLLSTFLVCKFAVPQLRKTRGNIINMSSVAALIGQAMSPAYASTKAGQIGLTRALAIDLAQDGIRVNAVCPAGVLTPLMRVWAETQHSPTDALGKIDTWHALGRMGTVEEIGEVCAFLASDEASFITGQAISPDGGASLGYRG